jgi:hypothetical protein
MEMGMIETQEDDPAYARSWRWSQPIAARLYVKRKDGVYGDESKISSRFHCGGENGFVGFVHGAVRPVSPARVD